MKVFKSAVMAVSAIIFCAGIFAYWLSDKYVVPIVMYHKVEQAETIRTNTVSPERFRRHLQYLKDGHYHVISLQELIDKKKRGEKIPHRSVVLTFDDGYENNYEYAFPILQEYQFPATIFISPGLVAEEGFLSWEQVQEMQIAGIQFGSHGMTEAYLPDQTVDLQNREITQSKEILEQRLAAAIDFFSFPVGGFSDDIKDRVKRAGYQAAVATNRGNDRFNKDLYELNRIRLSDKDDRDLYLWAKFTGYYNLFRRMKAPN